MQKALFVLIFLASLVPARGQAQQATPLPQTPPDLEFSVLEVRAMAEQEALDKSRGFVGPNILVRLRLHNKSAAAVLLLLVEDAIDPLACIGKEKRTNKNCWPKLLGIPNRWLMLPSGGAVEWEETDSGTFQGEKHYIGIMIKRQEGGAPEEVVSPPYTVPTPLYTPKHEHEEH
ncbi:MAG: hypothetical protein EHM61_06685 [Acidobacteria bacterium]|nr:MAG: hypothetical protein EHM61_06685 [Acidobacteriota bacterium]